jgi:hypothetical protein
VDYENYKNAAEPKDTSDKKCGQTNKNGIGWESHDCSHDHKFVCEKQSAGKLALLL